MPSFFATGIANRTVRLAFDTLMLDVPALVTVGNYTVRDLNGNTVSILSVTKQTATNPTAVLLHLAADLTTQLPYEVIVSGSVLTAGSLPMNPSTKILSWVEPLSTFAVPINSFGGEVQGGLYGDHGGLVFFSPALTNPAANSVIQVDQVDVCTRAYDTYEFPQLVDPKPLYTYSPQGTPGEIGPGYVLFAPWPRLSEFQVNFNRKQTDVMPQAVSSGALATFNELWDPAYVALLNNQGWKTFDNGAQPPTYFITAINTVPIPAGAMVSVLLEPFPASLDVIIFDILNMTDSIDANVNGAVNRTANDAIFVSDEVSLELDLTLSQDNVSVTDGLVQEYERSASDVVAITENLATEFTIGLSDSITATENIGPEVERSRNDTISVTDDITVEGVIISTDFSQMSLGAVSAASLLSSTGLTFVRSSASTVQTSPSTVDTSPSTNDACIGDRTSGGSRGLVIQHNVRQLAANGRNLTTGGGWQASNGTTTSDVVAGPDGQVKAEQFNLAAGQYSSYDSSASSVSRCFSSWQRSVSLVSNGTMLMGWYTAVNEASALWVQASPSLTWQRLVLSKPSGTKQFYVISDGESFTNSGGPGNTARNTYADMVQFEAGVFPTEFIDGGLNTGRWQDRLSYSTGSKLVYNSRVAVYYKMIPKFASSEDIRYNGGGTEPSADAFYVWSWGANGQNYAKFSQSDKKLRVKIANGTEVTSTNAISFARYDVLEIYLDVGNSQASVAKYRVNGGSWVDLVLASVNNVPSVSGSFNFLFNDNVTNNPTVDSGQFPCWLQEVKVYQSPSGAP